MNLQKLQKHNPQYVIKSIYDPAFQTYGKVRDEKVEEAIQYVTANVQPPQNGNCYIASDEELEKLPEIQRLSQKIYGYLDVMAGTVSGDNDVLNGIEYHQCSETIIAVSDYVLVVGHVWDMQGKIYNSSLCECFYVPQGTVVEIYSTTLHYTPMRVEEKFQTICLLLRGTGDACEREGILKKKNKWFIAHPDNTEKVEAGDYPGLIGPMIKLKYDE